MSNQRPLPSRSPPLPLNLFSLNGFLLCPRRNTSASRRLKLSGSKFLSVFPWSQIDTGCSKTDLQICGVKRKS